jgi:ferredoxin
MSDFIERRVGRYTIRIDRHLCVGFGDCIDEAAALFELDDESIVRFIGPDTGDGAAHEQGALRACGACPVDAIIALDENGTQVVP